MHITHPRCHILGGAFLARLVATMQRFREQAAVFLCASLLVGGVLGPLVHTVHHSDEAAHQHLEVEHFVQLHGQEAAMPLHLLTEEHFQHRECCLCATHLVTSVTLAPLCLIGSEHAPALQFVEAELVTDERTSPYLVRGPPAGT